MLEANRINLVEPKDVTFCEMCGARYAYPDVAFIGFDNRANDSEDIPSGLVETYEERAGVTAYRARDVYSGSTTLIQVRKPMLCSDCVKQAARLVDFDDTAPLRAELADLHERLDATRKELQQSEVERIEANDAVRNLRAELRAVGGGSAPAKRTAKAKA
jgi:hypothetical protein